MSPTRSSSSTTSKSRSGSPPYSTRRTSAQQKRQQYSACGACRMRRVRCDLKDLPISPSGQHPACSNCKERNLKCVDEFAEVKAVKLLRRGRRLQQVEAVYGKVASDLDPLHAVQTPPSVIPKLRPEFFSSPFFRRFHIQRPILEPEEYCSKFVDFSEGNMDALSIPGQLISYILVVWAASFGVDEYGREEPYDGQVSAHQRREYIAEMLQEMLFLIDVHGILRKPSWDGVRLLLFLLPLTQEVLSSLDRLAMFEATLSQIYTLCSTPSAISVVSGQGEYIDALVRARIFWYAHVLDGITNGLRGGRLLLTNDDLTSFEHTLPPVTGNPSDSSLNYVFNYRYATIPIRVSTVCRDLHAILTGPKARQSDDINEEELHHAWSMLDTCWKDFEGLKQFGTAGIVQAESVDKFVHGWQIYIFKCHNIIREALKQRLVLQPSREHAYINDPSRPSTREILTRLHATANLKCHQVVRHVVSILRRYLGTSFLEFDAGMVRDGCFFAGFLLAGEAGGKEDVDVCLQALSQMRWAFSKGEERERTVRMVWESRISTQTRLPRPIMPASADGSIMRTSGHEYPFDRRLSLRPITIPSSSISPDSTASFDAPSAPHTACTDDGNYDMSAIDSGLHPHDPSASHHGSPLLASSSSAHSPRLGMSSETAKGDLGMSRPLILGEPMSPLIHSSRPPLSCANPSFMFGQYNFVGSPDGVDEYTPQRTSDTLSAGPSTYHLAPYFDSSDVMLNSSIGRSSHHIIMNGEGDCSNLPPDCFYQPEGHH